MDGYSAKLLLSALIGGRDPSAVLELGKELNKDSELSDANLEAAEALKGRRCTIKGTTYVGTIMGANTAAGGFYPGSRYPVLVNIDRTADQEEETFPYSLDQVIVQPLAAEKRV